MLNTNSATKDREDPELMVRKVHLDSVHTRVPFDVLDAYLPTCALNALFLFKDKPESR